MMQMRKIKSWKEASKAANADADKGYHVYDDSIFGIGKRAGSWGSVVKGHEEAGLSALMMDSHIQSVLLKNVTSTTRVWATIYGTIFYVMARSLQTMKCSQILINMCISD